MCLVFLSGDGSSFGDQSGTRLGNGRLAFAQLGHGGYDSDANNATGAEGEGHDADIEVNVGGKVRFEAVTIANDPTGGVSGPLYTNTYNYVQLGHGGYGSNGDHRGDITVDAGTGIEFTSGSVMPSATANLSQTTYAQLGHGGYGSPGYGGNDTAGRSGDISVLSRSGDILLQGGNANNGYVMLGHGGRSAHEGSSGDVRVAALNGNIEFKAGGGSGQFAQLGHGGYDAQAKDRSGDVIVRASGQVVASAGTGTATYVQIGHGGYNADSNAIGNVIVSAGSGALSTHLGTGLFDDLGDYDRDGTVDSLQFGPAPISGGSAKNGVTLSGGTANETYVMIGHGGRSAGNASSTNAATITGKIGVEAAGDIEVSGGSATRSFAQVGHGGWEDAMNMSLSGDISVISQTGALGVFAGSGSEAYSLIGHGALRNSLAAGPSGTRTGHIYLEADNWNITPNGTTSLARIGHTSSNVNNGVTAGNRFTVYGNGGGGTTSYAINSAGYSLIGAQDHLVGGGDVTFAAQGDLSLDASISANSAGKVNLLATGNLDIRQRVQNAGTGAVSAVGGWDGHTGMSGELPSGSLDFVVHVPERTFNIAPVLADKNSWGNNNGGVRIGDGTQTSGIAVGSAKDDTTVLGYEVALRGSDTTGNGFAQIGAAPASGASPSGDIIVRAKEGGIEMEGGSVTNTYTQIGHRALGAIVPTLSGAISVDSDSDLILQGGDGLQSSSQIGHGGPGATVNSISGDVTVNIVDDIQATGGTGGGAYVQIGHGGSATKGAMSGAVNVTTGGNLELLAPHIGDAAYAKIGHGDDLRGSFAANGGTGTRDGAVVVSSDGDITIEAGQIGHVGASSPATQGAGATTWIGVARSDPEDPTSGSIIADGASQFAGSQVRIYLPERQNNQVAPGAWIAGTVYGGVKNPWPVQQLDEYTNYIETLDGSVYQPGQHDNSLGDGPVPVSGYAFYYNMIELAAAPPVPPTPPTPQKPTQPTQPLIPLPTEPTPMTSSEFFADDRFYEEWLRSQAAMYRGPGSTNIYYEGYRQYGPNGESVYQYGFSDAPGLSADEEDVLKRHLRHLDEATEQGGASAPQAGTGGEE